MLVTAHVERHAPSAFWLAYSGGLDSTVLLHIVSRLKNEFPPIPVKAIHIHHGLQVQADEWVEHCNEQCQQRNIPLEVKYVDAKPTTGESPEAVARDLRYAAIAEEMEQGAFLWLGQHQDDQVETLLLQLLRGAGPKGLAAMAVCGAWGQGYKFRPLLDCSRDELEVYAREQGLSWVEDPSNQAPDYDRNFLRHQVIPVVKENWPGLGKAVGRSAALCAEADELMQDLAALDAQDCITGDQSLRLSCLSALSSARRRNLLRYWAIQQNLPLPSYQALIQVEQQLLDAREDAQPQIEWGGISARRYRDALYLVVEQSPLPDLDIPWDPQQAIPIPGVGTLKAEYISGQGLSRDRIESQVLHVRFRRGGEQIKPVGDNHTRALQKLMQREGIPPWLRERIPLIFVNNELVAVVGYWYSEAYAAGEGEEALHIKLLSDCL